VRSFPVRRSGKQDLSGVTGDQIRRSDAMVKYTAVAVILLMLITGCGKKEPQAEMSAETEVNPADMGEAVDSVPVEPPQESAPEPVSGPKPETLSEAQLWECYTLAKQTATRARDRKDLEGVVQALEEAAQAANSLNRPDIEAWQYNNIGYYTIQTFQDRTGYMGLMARLEAMPPGREKTAVIKETRTVLRDHFSLLEDAAYYLEKAREVDAGLDPSERTEKIKSNLDFIRWVRDFTNPD
jgi:hypothetical protein